MQYDVELLHEIEAVLGKQLEEFECKDKDSDDNITKVFDCLVSIIQNIC